jgi:SAM-dependent methyltransferase
MVEKKYLVDPKKRFSSRVENYIKYRPSYPLEILNFLKEKNIIAKDTVIADVGSGTGILTKIFLDNGNRVYGIEPNKDMREAAENILKHYNNFYSIEGSAEATGLEENSIDLIIAGQSFHWFDVELTKIEFKRILKEDGHIIILWNSRKKSNNEFSQAYENLISTYGKDYKQVRMNEGNIEGFFHYQLKEFYNFQNFDFEGLKGRLLSASYMPLENDPNYEKMIVEIKKIFVKHKKNGKIRIEYNTKLYYGRLD